MDNLEIDPVDTFVSTFRIYSSPQRAKDLSDLLQDAAKYFDHIADNDTATLALTKVFDREHGLLEYLRQKTVNSTIPSSLYLPIKEAFYFVGYLIRNFHDVFEPYILQTKEICEKVVTSKTAFTIQRAAGSCMCTLIRFFRNFELHLRSTVESWMTRIYRFSDKEKALLYKIIGDAAKYDGSVISGYSFKLYDRILSDLQETHHADPKVVKDKHGAPEFYFEALNALFETTQPHENETQRRFYYESVYKIIKEMSAKTEGNFQRDLARLLNAGLKLLVAHMSLFQDGVVSDAEYWYDYFHQLLTSSQDEEDQQYRLGYDGFRKLCQTLAQSFLQDNEDSQEERRRGVTFLKERFERSLQEVHDDQRTLQLIIYGFSEMARPCRHFLSEDEVERMFFRIVHLVTPMLRDEESTEKFGYLPDYQLALTKIIVAMSTVTQEQMQLLCKLCVASVKMYPDMPSNQQRAAETSLSETIVTLEEHIDETLFRTFLDNLFEKGLLWTCSHTLQVEADLAEGSPTSKDNLHTYKSYLKLWLEIFRPRPNRELRAKLHTSFVNVCAQLLEKLNLGLKFDEDRSFASPLLTQTAENQTDFRVFLNLVDHGVDLFQQIRDFLEPLAPDNRFQLLLVLLKRSYENPLVSGYYRLLNSLLRTNALFHDASFQRNFSSVFPLLQEFIDHLLDNLIDGFTDELFLSAAKFLVDLPLGFLPAIFQRLGSTLRRSLEAAPNLPPSFALETLEKLESWTDVYPDLESLQRLLLEILPLLDNFLRHKGDRSPELQHRILLFFGKVLPRVRLELLRKDEDPENSRSVFQDPVKLHLDFPGATRLELQLDELLRKLVTLSLTSSERGTRLAAAESLHASARLLLGKRRRHLEIHRVLLPALIRLAADGDELLRQLFEPLVFQIVRYFADRVHGDPRLDELLLETIFQQLLAPDVAVREFAGSCLARSLLTRKGDEQQRLVLERVTALLRNPLLERQVAAALAFNHVYFVLRETDEVLDDWYLYLFQLFARSFQDFREHSSRVSLGHILKVFRKKRSLFSRHSATRRGPIRDLADLVDWVFAQLESRSTGDARAKFLQELFLELADLVDGVPGFLERYEKNQGRGSLLQKLLDPEFQDSLETMDAVLENFLFATERHLVPNLEMRGQELPLFRRLRALVDLRLIRGEAGLREGSRKTLVCEIVPKDLKFMRILLESGDIASRREAWSPEVFRYLSDLIFQPETLGFESTRLGHLEKLSHELELLLESLRTKLNEHSALLLRETLVTRIREHQDGFFDVPEILRNGFQPKLSRFADGLILLEKRGILRGCYEMMEFQLDPESILTSLFENLKKNLSENGPAVCVEMNPDVLEHLRKLLTLSLENLQHPPRTISQLLRLMCDPELLQQPSGKHLEHGELFRRSYGPVLEKSLSRYPVELLDKVLLEAELLHRGIEVSLEVILGILTRQGTAEDFSETILREFVNLHVLVKAKRLASGRVTLQRILGRILALKNHEGVSATHPEVHERMVSELLLPSSSSFSQMRDPVRLFLPSLVKTFERTRSDEDRRTLRLVLEKLLGSFEEVSRDRDELEFQRMRETFESVLDVLPGTTSVFVFREFLTLALQLRRDLERVSIGQRFLEYFQKGVPNLETLRVFRELLFQETTDSETRDFLSRALFLPVLRLLDAETLERLLERELVPEFRRVLAQQVEDPLREEAFLVSLALVFEILPVFYLRVPEARHDRELRRSFFRESLETRKRKLLLEENRERFRRLQCSAYNFCVTMTSFSKQESSYTLLFAVKPGYEIWGNVLPRRPYKLSQTVKEVKSKRRTLINVRRERDAVSGTLTFLHSYDLTACSLLEDVHLYDFNASRVTRPDKSPDKFLEVILEDNDDLNNHECMDHICGVLRLLEERLSAGTWTPAGDTPEWLRHFLHSLRSIDVGNTRIFLLKVLTNVPQVFQRHRGTVAGVLLESIRRYLESNPLNYVVTDALLILIQWDAVEFREEIERRSLQTLLELLVRRSSQISSKEIQKYDLELISAYLERFRAHLRAPRDALGAYEREFSSRLAWVFLRQGFPEFQENVNGFFLRNIRDWMDNEELLTLSCRCLGKLLASGKLGDIEFQEIEATLTTIAGLSPRRYARGVAGLCESYERPIHRFLERLVADFWKLGVEDQGTVLRLLVRVLPRTEEEGQERLEAYAEKLNLSNLLRKKPSGCEDALLRMTERVVNLENYRGFLPSLEFYRRHEDAVLRLLAFDVYRALHETLAGHPREDREPDLRLTRRILLQGAFESDERIREKCARFWSDVLSGELPERLEQLLELMSTDSYEDRMLAFLPMSLLELTRASGSYDRSLQEGLVPEGEFLDQEFAFLPPSARNLGLRLPLFATSKASRMMTLSGTMSSPSPEMLQFTPTQMTSSRGSSSTLGADPGRYERSRRFSVAELASRRGSQGRSSSRTGFRGRSSSRSEFRGESLTRSGFRSSVEEGKAKKERPSHRLLQKYRVGQLPDVELTTRGMIEPLTELLRVEGGSFGRDLTVSLCSVLLKQLRESNSPRLERTTALMARVVLGSGCKKKSPLTVTAMLETMVDCELGSLPVEDLARVSKLNDLQPLGALAIEEKLLQPKKNDEEEGEPSLKRMKLTEEDSGRKDWLYLANLYQSVKNFDVSLSIFKRNVCGKELQRASMVKSSNNWRTIKEELSKALERDQPEFREILLEGYYESLEKLSEWSLLDQDIRRDLDHPPESSRWDRLWNDELRLTYFLRANLHRTLELNSQDSEFLEVLPSWINQPGKYEHLSRRHAETFLLFLETNEVAQRVLRLSLQELLENWKVTRIHPGLELSRIGLLAELRAISAYFQTLKAETDAVKVTERLQNDWRISTIGDPEIFSRLASVRTIIVNLLLKRFDAAPDGIQPLVDLCLENRLQLAGLELDRGNLETGERLLVLSKNYAREHSKVDPPLFWLQVSKMMLFQAEQRDDAPVEAFKCLRNSWKHATKALPPLGARAESVLVQIYRKLASEPRFAEFLEKSAITRGKPAGEGNTDYFQRLLADLHRERAILEPNAENCYRYARFCFERIPADESPEWTRVALEYTLKAMALESSEASNLFACLLDRKFSMGYVGNPEIASIFEQLAPEVPTWMFLRWRSQLLSHLTTDLVHLVLPIVERIFHSHPNAMIYAFNLLLRQHEELLANERIQSLRKRYLESQGFRRYLRLVTAIVLPEVELRYHLERLLTTCKADGADFDFDSPGFDFLKKLKDRLGSPSIGRIHRRLEPQLERISMLLEQRPSKDEAMRCLLECLRQTRSRETGPRKLEDFFPDSTEFGDDPIEVPGFYGEESRVSRYHPRILRILSDVEVLPSKTRPVKIRMLGSDGRVYPFLVKFGEDLRLDERIQQSFQVLNDVFRKDPGCSFRNLRIERYQVIPVSTDQGLIQFLENTAPLRELLERNLTAPERQNYERIAEDYSRWFERNEDPYRDSVGTVTGKMREFLTRTDPGLLKRAMRRLSGSSSEFIGFRERFLKSYATVCAAGWLLGIGDRHLDNLLLLGGSGRCLAIDFGLAFDAAAEQAIPELVPFRLTPQLLELLRPFDAGDLFGTLLTHALRAVRCDHESFLTCMRIFIHEPLDFVGRIDQRVDNEEGVGRRILEKHDLKWLPNVKLSGIERKILGGNPMEILIDQLRIRHNDEQYFQRLIDIVYGRDADTGQSSPRASIISEKLSVEEQVQVLLDLATDVSVLGRSYVGWRPWL